VAEIAGSIREFGFTNPVLIDPEGGIIAGHGRVLASPNARAQFPARQRLRARARERSLSNGGKSAL
jgi:ParB-like chromosome segregation protein Spo0J